MGEPQAALDAWAVEDASAEDLPPLEADAWLEDAPPDAARPCQGCGPHAECLDGVCVCREGWRGDGVECRDIDECFEEIHGCDLFAETCANEEGGYACVCREGTRQSTLTQARACVAPTPKASLALSADQVCWRSGAEHFCASSGASHYQLAYTDGEREEVGYSDAPGIGDRGHLGPTHACVLDGDQVICWGGVRRGEIYPPFGVRFSQVAVGGYFACGLDLEGAIHCWGANAAGDEDPDPRTLPPEGRFEDLALGACGGCAARGDGRVECWGCGMDALAPDRALSEIVVGRGFACALDGEGQPHCWGEQRPSAPPPRGRFTRLGAGDGTACALDELGALRCWGDRPAHHPGPLRLLVMYDDAWCAVTPSDEVLCEGIDAPLERLRETPGCVLGPWEAPGVSPHVALSADEDAPWYCSCAHEQFTFDLTEGRCLSNPLTWSALSLGARHACGWSAQEGLRCWGENHSGQALTAAIEAEGVGLAAGGHHTCAAAPGGARCWGSDARGQSTPPEIDLRELTAGSAHTCGLDDEGVPRCWGQIEGTPEAPLRRIDAGSTGACGITLEGSLVCWGGAPAPPRGGDFAEVSVGEGFACALRVGGRGLCWGEGPGADGADLGAGFFAEIHAGRAHACALSEAGRVACWGDDAHGQASPPMFERPVVMLGVGEDYACAVERGHEMVCWGRDTGGVTRPPTATTLNSAPRVIVCASAIRSTPRAAGARVSSPRPLIAPSPSPSAPSRRACWTWRGQ